MAARFPMAVVVTGSPLTVTIEGASAVVAAEDFVGGLATDDRVQAAFLGDRLTVLAKAGGAGGGSIVVPIGGGISWWGSTDPASPGGGVEYAIPDGRALSRSTYAALFALWGTAFGAGNGTTTFNMPNAKGRVQVGRDSADADFDTMGETRGAKTHDHDLSDNGAARIQQDDDSNWTTIRNVGGFPTWTATTRTINSNIGASGVTSTSGAALMGSTDADSSVQPSIVANTAIRIK